MIHKLNIKRIILPIITTLILLVAMVSATATLRQSAYAYSWPCIDRSEGKAPMAISGNNLYVAWWGNGTGNYEVMFKASTDNGQTFGDKINLSNSTNGTSVEAGVAASGNNVYVTYADNKTGIANAYIRISNDNGKTFGPEVILTDYSSNLAANTTIAHEMLTSKKTSPYELKVAAQGDNVYVIATGGGLNDRTYTPDVFIRTSNDSGKTFGKDINLSESQGISSTRAQIEVSGNNVFVTWWESSNGKDTPMMRISHDSGQTFGEAIVLTAK
jgi:hypothetical protein